jgi:hypothetical protein
MKKFICLIAPIFFALSFCAVSESASVGAPGIQPEDGRFIFGLEYVSVRGRELFDEDFEAQPVDTEALHFLGTVKYGLSDRLKLFGKLGSSDLNLYGSSLYPHSSDMGWGGGFNFIVFEDLATSMQLIAGAQYYTYEPKEAENRSFKWQEWDASLRMLFINYVAESEALVEPFALSHATFYAGMRYSDAKVDWTKGSSSGTLSAEETFGYFAGIDFVFNENYIATIEGRFRDESAYTAAIGFKF